MESQLEDFLIENWDKTELGKKYDLIEEKGELISQQYRTEIGIIDILAQVKNSTQLVVIELKKNQTSDDTVGQLTRYMGWLEEHKTNGELTKGIIIAAQYDNRLHYALKKVKDVEVYLYRVDFKLEEFAKRKK
jgi:RecB family endonuclease NucS